MPDEEDKKPAEENDEEQNETAETTDDAAEETKPFSNLDGKDVFVFGWEPNAENKCWYNLSLKEKAFGWDSTNVKDIEISLKKNVDACYFYIASLYFVDLDDDIRYHAFFDNMKGLWKLEITDSPKAELDIQQIGDFFKSDLMTKAAKQCYTIITRAAKEFEQNLRGPLENAKFISIDEVKLSAILDVANNNLFMENLRLSKFMI